MDAVVNAICGDITVGDNTFATHGCSVLTDEHRFHKGRLASLSSYAGFPDVPFRGNDIVIGRGRFFGPGNIALKGVTIGDNVIMAAGSVVTKHLPSGCFAAGVPARVVRFHGHEDGEAVERSTERGVA
jgi:acetyltransferase-like isoleucine patch superfamily enzyme